MPKRILKGTVVAISGTKTISVLVSTKVKHPLYAKFIAKSKKYLVHDQEEKSVAGEEVLIEESAPFSKRKKWKLVVSESSVGEKS